MKNDDFTIFLDNYSKAVIAHYDDGVIQYLNREARQLLKIPDTETLISSNIYQKVLNQTQQEVESLKSLPLYAPLFTETLINNGSNESTPVRMKIEKYHSHTKPDECIIFRTIEPLTKIQEKNKLPWINNVLEHLRSGVVISDPSQPDNPIIYVNTAFENMTGYSAEEVLGRNCRFLQGTNKDQPALNILREAVKRKMPCHVILENYKKDGTLFINQLDISIVRDANGQPTHFVGIQNDITEITQQRAELVKQREIALTASKMAALGEMAGGISHEINNPLMVLRTHIDDIDDFLQSHTLDYPKISDSLKKMDETINRVAKIVKSLRDFSGRSDKKELQCESIDLIIKETLDFCQERLKNNNIDLVLKIQDSHDVLMRKIEISQILINLINNSIDELQNIEDKRIIIESIISDEYCFIHVSDYGAGITDSDKENIFNPFFTTKSVGKGTGLGLSISRKIMSSHGGTLELTNQKNPTTFTLKLRLKK